MQKYFNVLQDKNGRVQDGLFVQVLTYPAGTSASLFSDNGVTPQANPITTNNNGEFSFYAADGRYSLIVYGGNIQPQTYTDIVLLEDPEDGSDVVFDNAEVETLTVNTSAEVPADTKFGGTAINGSAGSSLVGFVQSGTGAVSRSVQSKLRDVVSVKDFGAVGDGVSDDTNAFSSAANAASHILVPMGVYNLSNTPSYSGTVTWEIMRGASFTGAGSLPYSNTSKIVSFGNYKSLESNSSYHQGVFQYLEQNSALNGYGNLGLHGSVRTGWRTSTGQTGADIAVSGFASNNLSGHLGGTWALYGTAVREAGAHNTHGCELDIANMGNTVSLFPAAMFSAGQTHALWLCSGGEITSTADNPGTASVAIGIISNDPDKIANFDKGIVFESKSISGTDGATGSGIAIALSTGHEIVWFNNSNSLSGAIRCTNRSGANRMRLDFGQFGVVVENIADGTTQFQVENIASAANRISVLASAASSPPQVKAVGSDADIDLRLTPKGTGVVRFGTWTSNADTAINGYVTIKDSAGTTQKLATIA